MLHLYRQETPDDEVCYNIETSRPLTVAELQCLKRLLAHGFVSETVSETSYLQSKEKPVYEVGPRLNFATAFHSNVLQICHSIGLDKVVRIERSQRMATENIPVLDRMTQCLYDQPLISFTLGLQPELVKIIPLQEQGPDALLLPGLAMDEADRQLYYNYFVERLGRNPTNVEIGDLNNANSEHSRHGYFKGRQIIDNVMMPETLMDMVKSTLRVNPHNSVLAFADNSSAIEGYQVWTLLPQHPGQASWLVSKRVTYHILFTAETHNFPTSIAPFAGAETGTGGRIRDVQAIGQGGLFTAGSAGYCVGHLFIPNYERPWENPELVFPSNLATSLEVAIQASNGASDYGNKFGEPVILGFVRSFDQRLPSGERWGWGKKVMFTGGLGQVDARHIHKQPAEAGMLIVMIGGPAYRIGVGGGAASSKMQGENTVELDFNAVQRGDAEMEQKMNRVIRACIAMGDNNPIVSIHDQGAGGVANILKELVEKTGGLVELRKINLGDTTMSVLDIWIAEYQERNGLIIKPERYEEFLSICVNEKVNCEKLGVVTDDGWFVVQDELDDTTPVVFELEQVLGNMPQKTFTDYTQPIHLEPLAIPDDLTLEQALKLVMSNLAVGSKRWLTNKVDRSVGGLIVQQQCCGPRQLPIADVAVVAQSHWGITGAATAIGEQPIKMLLDPAKGARLSVGEALTNLVWAKLSGLSDIKCSANWMWAPKLPGEGAALYDAVMAMRDLMIDLGIAVDGGKDSLSMAVVKGQEVIKSPRQLVISAYAPVPDIHKVVTPDIKQPGNSTLYFIDLAKGKCRLGGSIFAQVLGQISDDCPDLYDIEEFKSAWLAIQELIDHGYILAGHDVSDGGLVTTLMEMAFAGNCGFNVNFDSKVDMFGRLFAEELGLVIELHPLYYQEAMAIFAKYQIKSIMPIMLGLSSTEKQLSFKFSNNFSFSIPMEEARSWWDETAYQLELLQSNPVTAQQEHELIRSRTIPHYQATFEPQGQRFLPNVLRQELAVAILREEGSNGDSEMAAAFFAAGFDVWDVTMKELLDEKISLTQFRGLVAVGGFSYADYPDSAKGWATIIRENSNLSQQFKTFYERSDTFSLGVCNGCQLFALLGWVPWLGIDDKDQPRFVANTSGRFESRWVSVKIADSPAIMLAGMSESKLGIWTAHGEGKLYFPNKDIYRHVLNHGLIPLSYIDDDGHLTEAYPFNPNGSPYGIAGLCTPNGRHLAMMPHPERSFLKWQWPYLPQELDEQWSASPWLQMFHNAYNWCKTNS